MDEPDDALVTYLDQWNGRLKGTFLDLAILYISAFAPTKQHAYSIHKYLEKRWTSAPPLPTIYSTINRLEQAGLIRIDGEIENNRVRKVIIPTQKGWEAMEIMQKEADALLQSFKSTLTGGNNNAK